MTISYENMILNKSMILHLYNYAKEKVFEIIWNELFNPVVEIYLPTDNKGLEIHLPQVTGILDHCGHSCEVW
jgi:hypothetical protein